MNCVVCKKEMVDIETGETNEEMNSICILCFGKIQCPKCGELACKHNSQDEGKRNYYTCNCGTSIREIIKPDGSIEISWGKRP